MAAGDRWQQAQYGVADKLPLRGTEQVTGPPVEIAWDNGTRLTYQDTTALNSIGGATDAQLAAWLTKRVQGGVNSGMRSRGVVVDVYRRDPGTGDEELRLIVRLDANGMFSDVSAASVAVVENS